MSSSSTAPVEVPVRVHLLNGDTVEISAGTICALIVGIASHLNRFAPEIHILDMSTHVNLTNAIYECPPDEVYAIISDPPRNAAFWTDAMIYHAAVADVTPVIAAQSGSVESILSRALCAYANVGGSSQLRTRCVQTLLTARADCNAGDAISPRVAHARFLANYGEEASHCVHRACRDGHVDVLQTLIQCPKLRLDLRDGYGATPLLAALTEQKWDCALEILYHVPHRIDVDVNVVNEDDGMTALMLAVETHDVAVTQHLLDASADVRATDMNGNSALQLACGFPEEAIVRLLLDANASVNTENKYGRTPLMAASWAGAETIVKWLLEAHANVNAVDKSGKASLCIAAKDNHPDVCALLIACGANVCHSDQYRRTALFNAAQRGHVDIVLMLAQANAPLEESECIGYSHTPLFAALYRGHGEVCVALLDAEASAGGITMETLREAGQAAVAEGNCDEAYMQSCLEYIESNSTSIKT